MSTTGNEFERPGVNYPDREDADGATDTPEAEDATRDEASMGAPSATGGAPGVAQTDDAAGQAGGDAGMPDDVSHEAVGIGVVDGTDHHGHDEGRDTVTADAAQHTRNGLGSEQEQRLPAMDQNNAPDIDKVAGIVAQTRADVGTEPHERIVEVLHQRLDQSGVDLPDSDVDELARQVSTGDAQSPSG
ncbi:hypothetical protein K0817_006390 [Microbacterium sp. HD4P20]|uniref:hypothetical protein n=1 Tax=Microbacterium sp. HD4P20 TaxID=2864874 RepID=UPI0020A3DA7E|nr:hypothetical protein [Microbacterium sp. HD4P20]MCP2636197.1 hypothetical protein [Microbacterium sp. HD4P20]